MAFESTDKFRPADTCARNAHRGYFEMLFSLEDLLLHANKYLVKCKLS